MPNTRKDIIPLDNLKFDENNPRLPQHLQGIRDEKIIIDYMVKYGNVLELMKSIAETGYSEAEPLLVVLDDKDDKYIVVEGNRRLTALKLLSEPNLTKVRIQKIKEVVTEAKHIPTTIPVIIYSTRESILDYLGYRHITGVKEWGALEKARYLEQLYNIHYQSETEDTIYYKLAKMIGSRSDYVLKLYQALKLYNKANEEAYYGADIGDEQISFSWLTTALGYSGIVDFLGIKGAKGNLLEYLNEENYKKLFGWMFDPKKKVISDSREISDLANIVEQPLALNKLESGSSVEEAILYTSAPSESFLTMLKLAKQYLKQAKDAIEQLSKEPSGARDLLEDIFKITKTIIGGLDSNFGLEDDKEISLGGLDKDKLAALLKQLIEQDK